MRWFERVRSGYVDLLTVLTHEMGHALGLDDDSQTDPSTGTVMADVLPLGVRRIHLEGLLPQAPATPSPVEPVSALAHHAEGVTAEAVPAWAWGMPQPRPVEAPLAPSSPGSRAGAEAGPGRLALGPPLDAGVSKLLTAFVNTWVTCLWRCK